MKKIFKYFLYLILFSLLTTSLYILIAYIFALFPKKNINILEQDKEVYVLYNQVHSDIVFKIQDLNISSFPNFQKKRTGYLAFGWGDKETYLNTPNINDIKISTSIKALFINTPSLMHISYLPNIHHYQNVKTIKLSKTQQTHLKASILKSFNLKEKVHKGYGKEDFFYTAKGGYNLIKTCNTWTGDQLRESNISMSYWTPLSQNVINALP